MTNRLYWIDFVKALAITLVVLFHSEFCNYMFAFPLLAMCVPLFFVANGMLVLNKERDLRYYILKVCKIVFLMFVWSTIQTCVTMYYNGDPFILKDIYHSVISQRMQYCNTFWFMGTLTILYLLYPVVSAFVNCDKSHVFYMMIITYLLSFKAFGYVLPISPIPNIMRFWHGEALFYAVAGYFILKFTDSGLFKNIKTWQILLAMIFLWAAPLLAYTEIEFFSRHRLSDPVFGLYESPFVMLLTVFVVFLIKKINPKEISIVSILGKNTLGIYCLHPSIMRAIKYYVVTDNIVLRNGIVFFGALVLSLLVSLILQKSKYTRFLISL